MEKLKRIVDECSNAKLLTGSCFNDVEHSLKEFAPTASVLLAGRSSVRESLQNPGMYAEVNSARTIEVLELLRRTNCRRVIHASSVMVYGKDAPTPYVEDNIGRSPASFYGASKLATEILLNTWRELHGMEAINLRLFSVYGPRVRADCVPHLIAAAIRDQRDFMVFGDGSSVRDYIEINDVLNAIHLAVTVPWTKNFPKALNIGSGAGLSLIDLLRKLSNK